MIVCIYIGLAHFFGFKLLNFKILWDFHKSEYFGGYEDFMYIFGGSSQSWTSFRVIYMHCMVFP